ncbi:MAG: NAD(P)-dependent oxidoreductase [Hyphomicrobiaceae bacterium]|nr:NAD(P)-dependent oxidoreductase [Hyphomicrobiaceae bacterium]
MSKVAWIGLGVMGYPMAGHIREKGGHDLIVYNRTPEKAAKWTDQYDGETAATPAEAAQNADFIFMCVGNDDDLRQVTLGPDGVFSTLKEGAIVVDNTTASAGIARELHEAAKGKGAGFLDAPVSGGQAGAEGGVLTVMVGGDEDVYAKAEPVIQCFARALNLMGPAGSGQLTKMVNQICVVGVIQGLAEGLHFAKQAGLDIPKAMDTITKGAAQSWQMENRWETMIRDEFDYGFAVDWMRKDLAICMDEARQNGASLPVTAMIEQFYNEIQRAGGNRWDSSSLITLLERS